MILARWWRERRRAIVKGGEMVGIGCVGRKGGWMDGWMGRGLRGMIYCILEELLL